MKGSVLLALILSTHIFTLQAQNNTMLTNSRYRTNRKGQVFALWGWNRGFYSNSTLKIKGDDYDLTLYHLKAKDRPTLPVSYHNYIQLDRVTIPQTNFRVGYFLKDNFSVSLGVDHMKYIMNQDQVATVKGTISRPGIYQGTYDGPVTMKKDFLQFEHTDGLNYINVEVEKYKELLRSASDKFILSGLAGAGAGFLLPKTNTTLLDYERNDRFHLSGFGLDVKGGIQATFWKHFVAKFETKGGFIDMPDIVLHKKGINGRGKQHFFFWENDIMLGAVFSLNKN